MKIKIISVFILGMVFIYGIFVGAKKIFPYEQLRYVKNYFIDNSNYDERSPYYFHKKSQFELLSENNKYEIIMIGDSITDGGLWNELLKNDLIQNRGIGGDTTVGVLDRLNSINPSIQKAFIMIGINDFSRGRTVDDVYQNYVEIISLLTKKNIKVIIQSTLFVGKNKPNFYNENVSKLNEKLKSFAFNNNLDFIDLNRLLASNYILDDKYSKDEIHLNGAAYKLWADEIKKYF